MTSKDVDRPSVDLVLSDLKKEVEKKRPEPYVITLPSSQRVSFKYPLVYKRTERQQFQDMVLNALRKLDDNPLLERMLSEEDLAKYNAEDLDDDVHMAVLELVIEHFGVKKEIEDEGKGSGSGALVARFRKELRWDLAQNVGEDLAQLVADERWDALDDYIQGFPPNSHLNEAMAMDPEYADMVAEQDEPTADWAPRISQWDLPAVMRAEMLAALHGIQSAIIQSNGGKPSPYKPFPRPVTEIDGARERLEKRATGAMLEMAGFNPSDYL